MELREIRPGEIWDGDFVAVKVMEKLDFLTEKWSSLFAERVRFFKVTEARNNTFSAVDMHGHAERFSYNQITKAYRRE